MARLDSALRRIELLQSRVTTEQQRDPLSVIANLAESDLDQVIANLTETLVIERLKECRFERSEVEIEAELLAEVEAELAAAGQ